MLIALADPLLFASLVFAAIEVVPERTVSGTVALRSFDKQAVMLALEFGERIAQRAQEIVLAVRIVPSMLNSMACDFPVASIWPA